MSLPSYDDIRFAFANAGHTTRPVDRMRFTVLTTSYEETGSRWEVEILGDRLTRPSPTDVNSWVYLPYLSPGPLTARRILGAVTEAVVTRTDALCGDEPEWDEIRGGRRLARLYRDGTVPGVPDSGLTACATAPQRCYDHDYDPHRPEAEDTFVYVADVNRDYNRQLFNHEVPTGGGRQGTDHHGPGWSVHREDAPSVDERMYRAFRRGVEAGRREILDDRDSAVTLAVAEHMARLREMEEDLGRLDPARDMTLLDDWVRDHGDRLDDGMDEYLNDDTWP